MMIKKLIRTTFKSWNGFFIRTIMCMPLIQTQKKLKIKKLKTYNMWIVIMQ